jgi:hypothetical protein
MGQRILSKQNFFEIKHKKKLLERSWKTKLALKTTGIRNTLVDLISPPLAL